MDLEIGCSFVAFQHLQGDNELINLFTNAEQNKTTSFQQNLSCNVPQTNRFDYLSIKSGQIQKGYASDESPEKKMKKKKIKKRKPFCLPKIDARDKSNTRFYVESLQNRIKQLETQVQRLKSLNKLNLDYIKKINDSELIINGFFKHRQKIIQKMQKLSNAEKPDLRRVTSECMSICKKQGSYGSDRIKAVQYYFKQLVAMISTNGHKYLAQAAFKNSDLFNPASIDTWEDWRKELFEKLNLSPETLTKISQTRTQVMNLHMKFNQHLLQMYKNKCSLLETSRQIEIVFEKMNEDVTPLQTARLICFLQKYKFQNGFYVQESVRKMYEQLADHTKFSYPVDKFPQLDL